MGFIPDGESGIERPCASRRRHHDLVVIELRPALCRTGQAGSVAASVRAAADNGASVALVPAVAVAVAEPWATLPLLALMCSAVASLQSSVIPTARGLHAMGRDRTMGRVWTRISPRYGSPAAGTVVVMTVAALVAVLALAIPKLNEMILAAVNSIGLIVALYYGLTALACAVRFRSDLRTAPAQAVRSVLAPGISAIALLGIGGHLGHSYVTMSEHFELSPDNGWFMLAVPACVVLSGLVMAAWAKYRRRSPYFERRGFTLAAPESAN